MAETGYFLLLGNNHILFNILLSYRKIKVYRLETIDMGISHWNNGFSETYLISISTMVLIVRDNILW